MESSSSDAPSSSWAKTPSASAAIFSSSIDDDDSKSTAAGLGCILTGWLNPWLVDDVGAFAFLISIIFGFEFGTFFLLAADTVDPLEPLALKLVWDLTIALAVEPEWDLEIAGAKVDFGLTGGMILRISGGAVAREDSGGVGWLIVRILGWDFELAPLSLPDPDTDEVAFLSG